MASIFVSYRREDASSEAHQIYYGFVAELGRENVFIDRGSIGIGSDFAARIDEAVGKCDALIAVIGPQWLGIERDGVRRLHLPDDFVRLEVANALKRDILVVPVLVRDATMPSKDDLPDDLKPLVNRQGQTLLQEHWTVLFDAMVASLVKELARRAALRPAEPPRAAAPERVAEVAVPGRRVTRTVTNPSFAGRASMQPRTYKLGPDNARLLVKTGRHGAASKAGHDLVIEVASWEATLAVDEHAAATSVQLTADPGSLHVQKGIGGMQPISDADKADMRKTIDKDVLKRRPIAFESSRIVADGDGWSVSGDLTMGRTSNPVTFTLARDGASIAGRATITQSDWGIKPYSALFGSLKVNDDVTVEVEGNLA